MLQLNSLIKTQMDNNLKGIDMVVGAKGSPLQLILSSVYHVDSPTGNISLKEARSIEKNPMVGNSVPLLYGDNYEGFRIVGTNEKFIELYKMNPLEHIFAQMDALHLIPQKGNLDVTEVINSDYAFA